MSGLMWIAIAVGLSLLALATEVAVRWWLRRFGGYYVWSPGLRLHLHPDREVFPELERRARIDINADGERGDAVPRADGRLYRILVAGGSPVECALLDQPTSWPGMLQRLLDTPEHLRTLEASVVHVGNIGFSGVASQGLNVILEKVLPRYRRLDLIVIMVGGNDVSDWLAKGAPPSVQRHAVPTRDIFSCHPEGPFSWKPRRLAVVQLLKALRQRWLRPVKRHEESGRWVGRARTMRARAHEVRTAVADPSPMLRLFEEEFSALIRRAQRHAARVLVVRQPWFERDYTAEDLAHVWHGAAGNPQREEVRTFYSIDVLCRLMALVSERAAAVADELGVEHLDVMPVLEPSLETFYDFVHFTPEGAARVAAAVAAVILQRSISPERATSSSARGVVTAESR
jgi:lysophospholipase L1-like esterase